jgi:hypothetical protein
MKSPPQQFNDNEARRRTEAFIRNAEVDDAVAVSSPIPGPA